MNDKNMETVAKNLADVSVRHLEFTEACMGMDFGKMIVLFCEAQYQCVSLLADVCDDPETKLMLMEGELSCKAKLDEVKEIMEKLS
jgi:hypothetical protein